MHFGDGIRAGCFDQAEYISPFFIDPIGHAITPVIFLDEEVTAMCFGHVPGFDSGDDMHVHV
jgi:hypothetical protein